ncbi:protein of unknown function [Legionella fallonii LLAP-10]|uniref:Uncharacterized protein n=1 Tax=Legionella fallonii LLAP-10 TaxID=1212491 RepID=A0A098G853_9GAMM|nr:protein of unknown function [Legionella fallonii LLAP-10]
MAFSRKNPIIGISMCCSGRQDKKIWHKRRRKRTALTSIHLPNPFLARALPDYPHHSRPLLLTTAA